MGWAASTVSSAGSSDHGGFLRAVASRDDVSDLLEKDAPAHAAGSLASTDTLQKAGVEIGLEVGVGLGLEVGVDAPSQSAASPSRPTTPTRFQSLSLAIAKSHPLVNQCNQYPPSSSSSSSVRASRIDNEQRIPSSTFIPSSASSSSSLSSLKELSEYKANREQQQQQQQQPDQSIPYLSVFSAAMRLSLYTLQVLPPVSNLAATNVRRIHELLKMHSQVVSTSMSAAASSSPSSSAAASSSGSPPSHASTTPGDPLLAG